MQDSTYFCISFLVNAVGICGCSAWLPPPCSLVICVKCDGPPVYYCKDKGTKINDCVTKWLGDKVELPSSVIVFITMCKKCVNNLKNQIGFDYWGYYTKLLG